MQLTPSNKLKLIVALLLIASNVITATVVYKLRPSVADNTMQQIRCPNYIVRSFDITINGQSTNQLPILEVVELEDHELWLKINKNIRTSFVEWMPKVFEYAKPDGSYVMLSTDKYLSIRNDYMLDSGRRRDYISICNTIDMETGEILNLDDLVYVDEELVSLILTKGIVKTDTIGEPPKYDYEYPQEYLEKQKLVDILEKLKVCTMPYDKDNFFHKPSFYLRNDRLYFVSLFTEQSEFYIELSKIEHKLKVGKW